VGGFTTAVITFSLFHGAYFCEIIRSGVRSIPTGQAAAGRALGMSEWGVMRWIVLPQALRAMMPVIFSRMIVLFQDTALVYILSLTDFFGAASQVAHRDGRMLEIYAFVAAVYFVVCFALSTAVTRLAKRLQIIR